MWEILNTKCLLPIVFVNFTDMFNYEIYLFDIAIVIY